MASKGPYYRFLPCTCLRGISNMRRTLTFWWGRERNGKSKSFFPQRNLRPAEKGGPTKQPILPRVTQTSGDLWDRQWSHKPGGGAHRSESSPGKGEGSQHPVWWNVNGDYKSSLLVSPVTWPQEMSPTPQYSDPLKGCRNTRKWRLTKDSGATKQSDVFF